MPPKRANKKLNDERTAQRNAVRAALAAGEATAAAALKAKGKDRVTSDDVLASLRALGGVWPTQCRPNVAPDVKTPGTCASLFALPVGCSRH